MLKRICILGCVLWHLTAAALSQPVMTRVLVTAADGRQIADAPTTAFVERDASGVVLRLDPGVTKQTVDGIGSSFTESSAFVLAHLEQTRRREVMRRIFAEDGANFTLTRMHIGSCDFSVEGKYSYADEWDDADLSSFSIAPDREGFDPARYPGIRDSGYDLLPMILEAQDIKAGQADSELRIIGSAWTAPPWMKDTGEWFIPGSESNNWQGTGGWLKPEHHATYARYLIRFLDAYKAEGVDLWAITPVNEPNGNGGFWESMHFSAESQNDFVKRHLGPRLAESRHADTRLLIYDQNRDELEHWARVMLGDLETAPYVYGVAVHWYASTVDVFEEALASVRSEFPGFAVVHTEGCIDNLGNPAPNGIRDPAGFQEENWFQNDEFWWTKTATDWAYEAEWAGERAADHPKYVPVHRYARNIIVSLDHWMTGWVDWNVVLDARGGPNHANNFCGAPIMIDTATGDVYYTPIYHVLSQFSRTIRPGDVGVAATLERDGLADDALHACATKNDRGQISVQLLNTTGTAIELDLEIAGAVAPVRVPANAVVTVQLGI
ncbi:MAG: glycoside hydrolase family 30 beta sandwich domain-containing protein [Planctomycetota bacterium]